MKKKFLSVVLILAVIVMATALCFTACNKKGNPTPTPAQISERAMTNFLAKVEEANYVLVSPTLFTATVSSKDLVCLDFVDMTDYAVISKNGEIFVGILRENGLGNVSFQKGGTAVDFAKSSLLNGIISLAEDGNIWNLFYNDVEEPLNFMSKDESLKNVILGLGGYLPPSLQYMHDVYLVLDAENPTTAHVKAEMDDDPVARIYNDDIDITITFGNATVDARVQTWLDNPTYPAARTEWTEGDIINFNSLLLPPYGQTAIPFMPFISYAFWMEDGTDPGAETLIMRDLHATREDALSYVNILIQNGFEAANIDGEVYYLHSLRPKYHCYTCLKIDYDNGIVVTASRHYEEPTYDNFTDINARLQESLFPALDASESLTLSSAVDTADERTEGFLYLFDYELALFVNFHYENVAQAEAYLASYEAKLVEAGFELKHLDGADDVYTSEVKNRYFAFHFEESTKTFSLFFRSENLLSASDAQDVLTDCGFELVDMTYFVSFKDETLYQSTMHAAFQHQKLYGLLLNDVPSNQLDGILNDFVGRLEAAGYETDDDEEVYTDKNYVYLNKTLGLAVSFSISDFGETVTIDFDFIIV